MKYMKKTLISLNTSLVVGYGDWSRGYRFLGCLFAVALILPSIAKAVPLSDPINVLYYSLQLRGISFGATGETVGVHVYDGTDYAPAYGKIIITDLTTNSILYDFTSGNYGSYYYPGTFDTTPFVLPYGDLLQYQFSGEEYSNMSEIFGSTVVASGGIYNGMYPTYMTTETITQPGSVPDTGVTLSLLLLSLAALLGANRFRSLRRVGATESSFLPLPAALLRRVNGGAAAAE